MAFNFEQLRIWQIALELSGEVSDATKAFPRDEIFFLTSQMKRAADSVLLNITEGSTLQSNTEFSRFLVIANRSALEVIACLYLARRRKFLDENQFKYFYDNCEKLIAMIQALIQSLRNDRSK